MIGAGVTVMVQLAVAAVPVESTTLAVKLYVPAVVGVPLIEPVDASNVRPGGRLPVLIENVKGATPPVAASAELYATPTWAVLPAQASASGVLTVMVQLVVVVPAAVPVASTTFAVKLYAPAVVGVPVIAPVLVFNVKPGGKLPEDIDNV